MVKSVHSAGVAKATGSGPYGGVDEARCPVACTARLRFSFRLEVCQAVGNAGCSSRDAARGCAWTPKVAAQATYWVVVMACTESSVEMDSRTEKGDLGKSIEGKWKR